MYTAHVTFVVGDGQLPVAPAALVGCTAVCS